MLQILIEKWLFVGAVAGFVLFWAWESLAPFMAQRSRARHAAGNLILAGINATVLAVVFSGATVAIAEVSASRHWGLLHSVDLTTSVRVALAFLFLDAWNYGWHRLNHRFPILWRFHQVHHSDPVMDVSTATRFHCGEIAISATLRLPLIPILGVPIEGLILDSDTTLFCCWRRNSTMPTCHCPARSTGSFVMPWCLPTCTNSTTRVRSWKPTPTMLASSRYGTAYSGPIAKKRTADRFASVSIRSTAISGNRFLVSGWLLLFRPRTRKFRPGLHSLCQSESNPHDSNPLFSSRPRGTRRKARRPRLASKFVYIAQRTVWPQAGAMNRAPTSLTESICFHSWRPRVRKAG